MRLSVSDAFTVLLTVAGRYLSAQKGVQGNLSFPLLYPLLSDHNQSMPKEADLLHDESDVEPVPMDKELEAELSRRVHRFWSGEHNEPPFLHLLEHLKACHTYYTLGDVRRMVNEWTAFAREASSLDGQWIEFSGEMGHEMLADDKFGPLMQDHVQKVLQERGLAPILKMMSEMGNVRVVIAGEEDEPAPGTGMYL